MPTKKATTRRKASRKAATKPKLKVVRSKKSTSKKKGPLKAIGKKQTKTEIIKAIAERAEMSNKEVKVVFEALREVIECHMIKRGSGEISLPELGIKVRRVRKKATKKRKGRNPFTGEEIMIAAKPARDVIRVTALKALKNIIDTKKK